jgi:hypothetical protein
MFNLFGSKSKSSPAADKGKGPSTPSNCGDDGEDSPPSGQAPRSLDMSLRKLEADLQCLNCASHLTEGVRCEFENKSSRQKSCIRCRDKSLHCVIMSLLPGKVLYLKLTFIG